MNRLNWGIISTGEMAGNFLRAFAHTPASRPVAVYSRASDRAEVFGSKFGIERQYSEMDRFLANPDIDVVYIASTQNAHFSQIMAALKAGKPVVCEKPLTLNAAEARLCADEARKRGLFLMEAMWMRFFPLMERVRSYIADGGIGEPRLVSADFCLDIPEGNEHRLLDPVQGGGALLDLGVYPLSLAQMVLGPLDSVTGHMHLGPTGVDLLDTMSVLATNGGQGSLGCGLVGYRPREATITGSKGSIRIHDIFFRPESAAFDFGSETVKTEIHPFLGNGYAHEILHVEDCLAKGLGESPLMPMADSLNLLKITDDFRSQHGLVFPGESSSHGDRT